MQTFKIYTAVPLLVGFLPLFAAFPYHSISLLVFDIDGVKWSHIIAEKTFKDANLMSLFSDIVPDSLSLGSPLKINTTALCL